MLWEEASGIFQGKVCPERIAGCACAASNLQALAVRAGEQWLPSRSCEQFKPFPGISALQTLVQVALETLVHLVQTHHATCATNKRDKNLDTDITPDIWLPRYRDLAVGSTQVSCDKQTKSKARIQIRKSHATNKQTNKQSQK